MGCNSGTYAVHKGYIQGKLAVISQGLTGSTLTMHQRHLRWHIRGAHRQYKSSVHVSALHRPTAVNIKESSADKHYGRMK